MHGKQLVALLVCLIFMLPTVACAPDNSIDESTTTAIRIVAGGGGIGEAWLEEAAARFQELKKDYSYAPGKKGVAFAITPAGNINLDTSRSDAYMIYGIDRNKTLAAEAQRGYVANINDIMTEKTTETRDGKPISVDDKIFDEIKSWYQGDDGNYYGVPYIENYAGLSYNRDVFDAHGFYFVQAGTQGAVRKVSQKFGVTNYFLGNNLAESAETVKTVGPDGVPGTSDDGLPSTLVEFLCLCEYMKAEGVSPINLTGQYLHYVNFLQDGMLPSLIGYDRYRNIVYESDSKGKKVKVVTGFKDDETLFPGIDYIPAPIVEEVVITPECGYYSTWMLEKFYVDALLEIIEHEGYFADDAKNDNASHILAQRHFLSAGLGGRNEEIGMLIEASYWNYESEKDGNYASLGKTVDDIDVRWMPMPVTLGLNGETVTETNGLGAEPVLYEYTSSYLCINSRYNDDPEHLQAAKDFLRFLMTDAELSHWSVSNNVFKPMDYELTAEDAEKQNGFYTNLWELNRSGRVLYNWSESEIFQNNMRGLFDRGWGSGQFGTNGQTNMLVAMRKQGYTAVTAFIDQSYGKQEWASILPAGGSAVTDYNGVVSNFDAWAKSR